jgi:HTH-type transcriptional regulator / antitoxin HipB
MWTNVNTLYLLTNVNIECMLTNVNTTTMKKPATPATIGALARDARLAAGLSQSELGTRIGASRFWVAQFENGKPGAELGLALKALDALGLGLHVQPRAPTATSDRAAKRQVPLRTTPVPPVDLARIIAASTTPKAPSTAGWPADSSRKGSSKRS